MSKLSAIFDTVDNKTGDYQQSLADKLVESYMFEEQLTESVSEYTTSEIEIRIYTEAIEKGSEKEALKFVDGIYSKIDEGFGNLMKKAGSAIKKGAKWIKDKLANFFSSDIEKAIKKFNTSIVTYKKELNSGSPTVTESMLSEEEKVEAEAKAKALAIPALLGKMQDSKEINSIVDKIGKAEIGDTPLADDYLGKLAGATINIAKGEGTIIITLVSGALKIPFITISGNDTKAGGDKVASNEFVALTKYILMGLNKKKIVTLPKAIKIVAGTESVLASTTTLIKSDKPAPETPKDGEAPKDGEKVEDAPEEIEEEEPDAKMTKLAMYMAKGAKASLRKTGSTLKGTKSYTINVDNGIVLSLGDDEKEMTPIILFDKAKKKTVVNLSEKFTRIQMPFIESLLNTFIKEPKFKMEDISVRLDGIKLYITANGKEIAMPLIAGKQLIIFNGTAKIKAYNPDITATDDVEGKDAEGEAKATDGKDEKGAEEETAAKPTDKEVNETVLKAQFTQALKASNFMKNLAPLQQSMGIDPAKVQNNLISMAGKYQYILPEILAASSTNAQDYAPLNENEYLAYMANLQPLMLQFSTSFATNPEQKKPRIYDAGPYKKFLQQATESARVLSGIVNNGMSVVDDKKGAKGEAEKVGPSAFEELMKTQPAVAEALKNNVKSEQALLIYAKTIPGLTVLKTKESDFVSIINDMKEFKYFNSINPKNKVTFVADLLSADLSKDRIKPILMAIMTNGIGKNFEKIEPFNDVKTLVEKIKSLKSTEEIIAYFSGLKSEIFNKRIF